MRDPEFEVSGVRDSDVIHANKKDVPCIFRVTTSLMDPPGVRHQCLMLADSESEKTKWVVALNELHRILKKNKLPDRTVFRCREVLDNTVSVIKNALSACLIDRDRLVVGTDDGLFCVDLDRDGQCNNLSPYYNFILINVFNNRDLPDRRPEEDPPGRVPERRAADDRADGQAAPDETDTGEGARSGRHGVDQGGGHQGVHRVRHRRHEGKPRRLETSACRT